MSASGQNFRSYWANKKSKIFAANPIKQVHEGCNFIRCRRFPFKLNLVDDTSNGLDPKKNNLPLSGLEHQNVFDSKKTSSSIEHIEAIPDEDPEIKNWQQSKR